MTKVKLNPLITEISGTMGDFVFRKGKKEGEAVLAKRPDKSKATAAQRAHWDRFVQASDYAAAAKQDPEVWAHYQAEARRLDLPPRQLAMTDYLNGKNLLSE